MAILLWGDGMRDIEIFEYNGVGYNKTMNFGEWRVAIANFGEHFDKDRYSYLERHLNTDEVFELLSGGATLITGKEFKKTPLMKNKIYNVKRGAWHALLMDADAKVLIVENHDTAIENTEYFYFR